MTLRRSLLREERGQIGMPQLVFIVMLALGAILSAKLLDRLMRSHDVCKGSEQLQASGLGGLLPCEGPGDVSPVDFRPERHLRPVLVPASVSELAAVE